MRTRWHGRQRGRGVHSSHSLPSPTGSEGGGGRVGGLCSQRWLQEGPRQPKMASKIAQDSSRWLKTFSSVSRDRPRTASSGDGASKGRHREAKARPKPRASQGCLPSRLFAADRLLRPR
eukprot:904095-Pyramimonas_sp.AAC.1